MSVDRYLTYLSEFVVKSSCHWYVIDFTVRDLVALQSVERAHDFNSKLPLFTPRSSQTPTA